MSTYQPIASVTLSSAQSSVTFSGIPQTYTDLVLVANCGQSQSAYFRMYFNGDTANNYSGTYLSGDGTSAQSGRYSNSALYWIGGAVNPNTAAGDYVQILNIMSYSNTTTNKTVLTRINRASSGTAAMVGLWRNTAAVTSITIDSVDSASANFVSGSTFNLYGVANASITNVAKATGGDSVYTDGTYWYHIFRSSGTFTPTQALTADILCVAGGGAGGNNAGGGGGAGGFLTFPSQSVTAQAYTVTIGAGGAGQYDPTNGSNSQFGSLTAAVGGGRGGGIPQQAQPAASTGGSGGGGATVYQGDSSKATGAAGTAGQGNAGGSVSGNTSTSSQTVGAGGGGSSAVGANATVASTNGGNGGAGTANSYSGTSVTYAGGGGGGAGSSYTGGTGGSGGGGNGGTGSTAAVAGTANLGGGGGGGGNPTTTGASGGSGIVIVRYGI